MRARHADIDPVPAAQPRAAARRKELVERIIFWLFIAALAWTPFWYGSNDLVAWGINAMLFPGLTAAYEISILVKGDYRPIGIKNLPAAAVLFAAVLLWIMFQNATWVPSALTHPIWGMASD